MTDRNRLPSIAGSLLALCLLAMPVSAQDLRLAAPTQMADSGFLRHILPRFKFKHRVVLVPVAPGVEAEIALIPGGSDGARVFADTRGTEYRVVLQSDDPGAAKFLDWLRSAPGKAAIESFPRDAPPAYTTTLAPVAVVKEVEIDGDAVLGSRLALRHCGRCHVVDKRNRMGGIGSTPSFAAMRGRPHWFDLFQKYWSENPHPSFTEVVGVTEPFSDTHLTHIAPVKVTLDEIDAITAFVETLEPLDLGRPIQFD